MMIAVLAANSCASHSTGQSQTPPIDDDQSPSDDDQSPDDDHSPGDDDNDNDSSPGDDDDNNDDDFVWAPMSGDFPFLNAIWGTSPSDVFAVGDGIVHYDGAAWRAMSVSIDYRLNAVWGASSSNVFAVGGMFEQTAGGILHYDGSSWTAVVATPFTGIWGVSSTDVYATGGTAGGGQVLGGIIHYDGAVWSPVYVIWGDIPLSVWGSNAAEVYVGTENGFIWRGTRWLWKKAAGEFSCSVRGLWGDSSSDVFAVGDDPNNRTDCIIHYDGLSWTATQPDEFLGITSVWGSSAVDVFVSGCQPNESGGAMIHYDGSSWSTMTGGPFPCLNGIWGSGPGDVFAVGVGDSGAGAIYHYGPPE
jgi:hypothetical protein